MKVNEITSWLEGMYSPKAAEDWDNVGLLVGNDTMDVKHIFLALDLTEAVLDEALAAGADMVITHHPMIFSGVKKINNHSFLGRKILKLIKNDMAYYAMHTNYDILGMAELSADYLKLSDTTVLSVTERDGEQEEGFGRVGMLPHSMTLRECAEYVKKCNGLSDVKVYGDLEQIVEKAAICTGSGKSMIRQAIAADANVYITGDIDHHTGLDTVEEGLALIDAGHYGTEYIFAEAVKEKILAEFPQLKVTCAKVKSPYTIL